MRTIDIININGHDLVGTIHEPDEKEDGILYESGLLIFNFGQAPRSGHGDLASHLADILSFEKIITFRYDFPGLGDSLGILPENEISYWNYVENGGHKYFAKTLIERLQERFGLKKIFLCGLCGSTVTSLLSAINNSSIHGIIMLEPNFFITPLKKQQHYSLLNILHYVRKLYLIKNLEKHSWPRFFVARNVNLKTTKSFYFLLKSHMPIIAIFAEDSPHEKNFKIFYNKKYKTLSTIKISETNHVFTSGNAKEIIIRLIQNWIHTVL